MKIAQLNDTHHGIHKSKHLHQLLKKLVRDESFDVLVHCGDHCGTLVGHKCVEYTHRVIREYWKGPVLAVMGNHDYWHRGQKNKRDSDYGRVSYYNPSLAVFTENYNKCVEGFKKHDVHFLDLDGVWRHPSFPEHAIVGHSGWYVCPPESNDEKFLPIGLEGHTHSYLLKTSREQALDNLGQLTEADQKTVFVSHFPVINEAQNFEQEFASSWEGDLSLGAHIWENHGVRHFLNGHTHKYFTGPYRYESGTGYPQHRQYLQYQIISV